MLFTNYFQFSVLKGSSSVGACVCSMLPPSVVRPNCEHMAAEQTGLCAASSLNTSQAAGKLISQSTRSKQNSFWFWFIFFYCCCSKTVFKLNVTTGLTNIFVITKKIYKTMSQSSPVFPESERKINKKKKQ